MLRKTLHRTSQSAAVLFVLLLCNASPAWATTCANAIVINPASLPIVGQAVTCGTTDDLNSTTVPGAICGTGDLDFYKDGNEALYSFTPTITGVYQLTLEGQTWNSAMVYIGCPTLNNCLYGDGTAGSTVSFAVTLTAGTTYYIWFDTWPSPDSPCPGTFSLGPPPPPLTNDNPCQATTLLVNATCVNTTATTSGATGTTGVPAPTCANYNGGDVWFAITVPASGAVTVTTSAGVITDGGMALYTATACNGTFTQISCNDDANGLMPEIVASGLTVGSTVYVRFWEYGNDNPGSFSICATTFTPPTPPVCGAMFYDPGGASGNYANNTNYTVTICPINPGDMVSLVFSVFNTEFIDGLSIYDGTNTAAPLLGTFTGNTLPPLLMASNPSGCLTAQFISDGSVTYAGWAAQVICTTPPAGDCIYVLRMHDSGGNGWGTSLVRVRINTGTWTNYTVTATDNIVLIGVNLGNLIEIEYVVATGPNQDQNSYSIAKLGSNPYFTSATPPAAGITFYQTVTCGPPPAQPQDCAGGITICSSQAIVNNSSSTGDVMDLDASNQGCLSSGERQGTWYYFSPQTDGTIAFSIAPANGTDDYDFAVWGPYANAQCPTEPPLRCSYDAPGPYTTGLNSTATLTTEGAAGTGWVRDIPALANEVYVLYIDNFSTSGQAFNLSWQLTNTSLDCTTLPVELIALEATANDPVIDVTWATATEHNSQHFTVERSPDNEVFTPIGTVAAAGNAQFRNDYLFVDESPFRGVNYYRLEQVDLDGTTKRSHTVVASLSEGDGRPSIYPNPATDELNVVFATLMDKSMKLVVLDALGRTVISVNMDAMPGQRTTTVPIDQLAPGWYSLRIDLADGGTLTGGQFLKK
ncbi:MAG TPA: hypothetical protein PLJ63_11570 [Flavobacteriales bacterium]|nr:hypothetical protein [Flavobacteriales bacterium]